MSTTLYFGTTLATTGASLQPESVESVYHRIRDDRDLAEQVQRLRRVRQMDKPAYDRLKVNLPFICCGRFREGIRRTEYFEDIQSFVIDIDHYSGNADEIGALRQRLAADDRVVMAFVSPGGDGLKVVFRMASVCRGSKQFSDFYKAFAHAFGEQYGLTRFIDFKTADVTRICFLSHDPEAYINSMATEVEWEGMLPERVQPMLFEKPEPEEKVEQTEPVNQSHQIRPDVYAEILRKLQTKARPNPVKRDVVVPEVLNKLVEPITRALVAEGLAVESVRDISYGKQYAVKVGLDTAECNVFYGAKGFSVVVVPKKKTNPGLGELMKFLIEQAIFSQHEWMGATDSDGNKPDAT